MYIFIWSRRTKKCNLSNHLLNVLRNVRNGRNEPYLFELLANWANWGESPYAGNCIHEAVATSKCGALHTNCIWTFHMAARETHRTSLTAVIHVFTRNCMIFQIFKRTSLSHPKALTKNNVKPYGLKLFTKIASNDWRQIKM